MDEKIIRTNLEGNTPSNYCIKNLTKEEAAQVSAS
jgi:hypothetical protein